MLKLEGLRIAMPGFELRVSELKVAKGEIALLQAPSGSGKTTLLRAIAGLQPVVGGRISWEREEVTALAPGLRGVGFVFQDGALFPALTVGENTAFGLRARGVGRREAGLRAEAALERVGLGGFSGRSVDGLSGGERQRVAWARALVWEPRTLLLDEPFAALDAGAAEVLGSDLLGLLAKTGTPTLIVSHGELPKGIVPAQRWGIVAASGSDFAKREVRALLGGATPS